MIIYLEIVPNFRNAWIHAHVRHGGRKTVWVNDHINLTSDFPTLQRITRSVGALVVKRRSRTPTSVSVHSIRFASKRRQITCKPTVYVLWISEYLCTKPKLHNKIHQIKYKRSWYFVDRASQYNLFFFISNLIHCFSFYVQYLLSSFLYMFQASQAHHQEI